MTHYMTAYRAPYRVLTRLPAIKAPEPIAKQQDAARKPYHTMNRKQVDEIWQAQRQVTKVLEEVQKHMKAGNLQEAIAGRRTVKRIKDDMKERFDLIL